MIKECATLLDKQEWTDIDLILSEHKARYDDANVCPRPCLPHAAIPTTTLEPSVGLSVVSSRLRSGASMSSKIAKRPWLRYHDAADYLGCTKRQLQR